MNETNLSGDAANMMGPPNGMMMGNGLPVRILLFFAEIFKSFQSFFKKIFLNNRFVMLVKHNVKMDLNQHVLHQSDVIFQKIYERKIENLFFELLLLACPTPRVCDDGKTVQCRTGNNAATTTTAAPTTAPSGTTLPVRLREKK